MIKPIELTEKHKEMLLEMCRELYPEPEFSFWWEYEMYGRGLKQSFNDVLCVSETLNPPINVGTKEKPWMKTTNYFNIHWFEFVVTKLFMKVFPDKKTMFCGTPCNSSQSLEHYEVLIHWLAGYPETYMKGLKNYHPIEYLYKHFIKIKKNDNNKEKK